MLERGGVFKLLNSGESKGDCEYWKVSIVYKIKKDNNHNNNKTYL